MVSLLWAALTLPTSWCGFHDSAILASGTAAAPQTPQQGTGSVSVALGTPVFAVVTQGNFDRVANVNFGASSYINSAPPGFSNFI
jgi:hypothetical protein